MSESEELWCRLYFHRLIVLFRGMCSSYPPMNGFRLLTIGFPVVLGQSIEAVYRLENIIAIGLLLSIAGYTLVCGGRRSRVGHVVGSPRG